MVKYLLTLCLCASALTQVAMCAESTPITGAQSFDLTAKQRRQFETSAGKGSATAALQLSKFYSFVRNDTKNEIKWLRRAAELGHGQAQYNLGYVLLHDEDNRNLIEAERWLTQAEISARKKKDEELLVLVKRTQLDLLQAQKGK